jgi:hypothetical protein
LQKCLSGFDTVSGTEIYCLLEKLVAPSAQLSPEEEAAQSSKIWKISARLLGSEQFRNDLLIFQINCLLKHPNPKYWRF